MWDYKNINLEGLQKSTNLFNREKGFEKLSIIEKVDLLNSILLNKFHNYIRNKIVKSSCQDPPWITKQIKSKLKSRSKITKEYYRKGQDSNIFVKLSRISSDSTELIRNAKMS